MLGLAASAGMATAVPAVPSPVRIRATGVQLLQLAEQFKRSGQTAKAKEILVLLSGDKDADIRNEARFRHAKVLVAEGQITRAALLLREIIDDRPDAAPVRLELAGLLDKMGDQEGAWRQVRAIHAGGLPPEVARIVDRYSEALRARRLFGASFEIALAPDSNINRATRSDTLGTVLGDFQIADDGKEKTGTGVALNGQAYRRFSLGMNSSLLVRVGGFADLFPDKQFNEIAADIGVGPEFNLGRDRLQLEVGATQRWFGQEKFMRSARIAATFSHPLGGLTLIRLNGSAWLVDNQRNDLEDGKTFSGQVSLEHALTPTTGIAGSLGLQRLSAKDPGYSTTGWRGSLTGWRDMGRMTLTASAELGRLHADERLILFPHKRADKYTRFSIGATFRQLQIGGFAPVARYSFERNKSKIELYDYRRRRAEIGVVRAF